jgi:hypothetical protein
MRGQLCHHSYTGSDIKIIRTGGSQFKALEYLDQNEVNTETIKEQISVHGPVVSRSFMPHTGNCSDSDYPILCGWETLPVQGEVWIVRTQKGGDTEFKVAFGTLSIELDIAIPVTDAKNEEWQPGYYLETDGNEWKGWTGMNYNIQISKFMKLWRALGATSASDLLKKKLIFHFYSDNLKADSVAAYINDFEFKDISEDGRIQWVRIHTTFVGNEFRPH